MGNNFVQVNAETVTILLQMISGLREVVLETILRARDKLKEATEKVHQKDSEIVSTSINASILCICCNNV